ncbi:MAG TPA: NAD(P)-dependent oxidoreductase [Acidimicrobiia bacterium]|jgi:3-hydroxyisobutyrate dehydrogenase-like beta-hydroxyacid dehydrogenase|nr:NAD(P)-dependent oxidoreductase [Acidimicrobiia bacterium]
MAETIGVIGLGVMGSAMAGHLVAAGFEIHGFDIDGDKATRFGEQGGIPEPSAVEVASRSGIVLFSLPTVEALDRVAEEVAKGAHEGLIAVEMGTLPIEAKQRARALLAESGVELMDVPVSGTGLQAADATLVVLASGSPEAFERTKPVFEVIGRSTHYLGEFGNGSVMKYISNLLVAVHNLSTAEAHALGIAAGIDPETVQRVTSDGVGSSRIFEIRGPMMVEDEYLPASARLDIILKDARIIKAFADGVGAPTPLLDAAIPVYEESAAAGLGDLDAAALCRYLEQSAHLERTANS